MKVYWLSSWELILNHVLACLRIGKEASMILRSCGWTEEVRGFMHATKKLCQETGNSASTDLEMK